MCTHVHAPGCKPPLAMCHLGDRRLRLLVPRAGRPLSAGSPGAGGLSPCQHLYGALNIARINTEPSETSVYSIATTEILPGPPVGALAARRRGQARLFFCCCLMLNNKCSHHQQTENTIRCQSTLCLFPTVCVLHCAVMSFIFIFNYDIFFTILQDHVLPFLSSY